MADRDGLDLVEEVFFVDASGAETFEFDFELLFEVAMVGWFWSNKKGRKTAN